jgi:hypothetical protein
MAVAPTKRHKRIWPLIVVLPCTLAGQADWPTGLPLFPVVTFFHRGRKSRLSTGGIDLWAGPSCHVPYISCTHPDYLCAVPTFRYFVFSGSRQLACGLCSFPLGSLAYFPFVSLFIHGHALYTCHLVLLYRPMYIVRSSLVCGSTRLPVPHSSIPSYLH